VTIIETRTLFAYALILLLAGAAIFGIVLARYNSHERKRRRRRSLRSWLL
jgi:hypothetical protein